MKRRLLLSFLNHHHHHRHRSANTGSYGHPYHSTTELWFRSKDHLSTADFERYIKEQSENQGKNRNNQNESDLPPIPTSLEDIPHWTERPIAKQQQRDKIQRDAPKDHETYWREAFATKEESYYRAYFNFGFVGRGEYIVQVPVSYPTTPTFLPRQWKSSSSSSSSKLQLLMSSHSSTSIDAQNNHPTVIHDHDVSNEHGISNHTNEKAVPSMNNSTLAVIDPNDAHRNDKVEEEEPAESVSIENEHNNNDNKLRIVDVDCNLWHKDLLQFLLPKPPLESMKERTTRTGSDVPMTSTRNDTEIPDCLQILYNDDLSSVVAMITPSSTIAEAAQGLEVLNGLTQYHQNDNNSPHSLNIRLRTTVGVHPYHVPDPFHNYHDANDHQDEYAITDVASTMNAAKRLLEDTQNTDWICAIGECGLDTTTGFPPIAYQIPYFTAQIELANEFRLPLFIHERNAHGALIELLDEYVDPDRIPNIIIHCFTGNVLHCETYMKRGYYISLSGFVFREKEASQVQLCLEHDMIPLDRLMIETDSPYMGFTGCRELFIEKNLQAVNAPFLTSKQRKVYSIKQNYPNPPSSIIMVLHQILHHINIGRANRNEQLLTVQELADVTTRNANAFFGLGL